jgi:hypothetical protein
VKNIKPAYVGLGAIGLGLLFILLGWIGAARLNYVDGQIPFLISGAGGGLAFIGIGTGVLLFESGRRARAHLEEKIDELIEAVRASKTAGSNGTGTLGAETRTVSLTPLTIPTGMVVVGRSSFHRPNCRLVEGKDDLAYEPLAEAVSRGLMACRVCDPARTTTGATAVKRARR